MPNYITLQSGQNFEYGKKGQTLLLADIVAGLRQARYTGQTDQLYTIAQHGVFVSEILREWGCDAYTQYLGLHHDDHEALIGDFPTPFQWWLTDAIKPYLKDEHKGFDPLGWAKDRIDEQIMPQLGIVWPPQEGVWMLVKAADRSALICEAEQLFSFVPDWLGEFLVRRVDKVVDVVSSAAAAALFLDTHERLAHACGILTDRSKELLRGQ